MVYSILMTDLQNGADRERVGAMVSLYNRLMNQIRMTLDENDSIRIDAENKEKSLKNEMEKYGQLLKERDKQIVKLFKKQNLIFDFAFGFDFAYLVWSGFFQKSD